MTIRDGRSYDCDITKVNRITWTYVLIACIPMPIRGDQAFLKMTAFYVQKLFKIKIGKEEIKNPFHAV